MTRARRAGDRRRRGAGGDRVRHPARCGDPAALRARRRWSGSSARPPRPRSKCRDASADERIELPRAKTVRSLALYLPSGRRIAGRGPASGDAVVLRAVRGQVSDARHRGSIVVAVPVTSNEQVIARRCGRRGPESAIDEPGVEGVGCDGRARRRRRRAGRAGRVPARPPAHPSGHRARRRRDAPRRRRLLGPRRPLGHRRARPARRPPSTAPPSASADWSSGNGRSAPTPPTNCARRSPRCRSTWRPRTRCRANSRRRAIDDALSDVERLERTIDDLLLVGRDIPSSAQTGSTSRRCSARVEDEWHGQAAGDGRDSTFSLPSGLDPVWASTDRGPPDPQCARLERRPPRCGPVTVAAHNIAGGVALEVSDDEGPRRSPLRSRHLQSAATRPARATASACRWPARWPRRRTGACF